MNRVTIFNGGSQHSITVPVGTTISRALEIAGVSLAGDQSLSVNSVSGVSLSQECSDGDRISVTLKKMSGAVVLPRIYIIYSVLLPTEAEAKEGKRPIALTGPSFVSANSEADARAKSRLRSQEALAQYLPQGRGDAAPDEDDIVSVTRRVEHGVVELLASYAN